ncbi:cyclodeaminase/cyclohydrolase family protein [Embleya sp. MST-111070]|uniref:cyclodeaminase/cyclohydrolase family protein n=1 Tax=Embleya sp. MST-111070 TaxID=3398231 RepID=UPI003F7399BE
MQDEKIGEYLARLADRVPAPGGGAAAALHIAQATALLGMVARYTTGEQYTEHATSIAEVISLTDELRAMALRLAEADAAAFTAVTEAYKLPRETAKEVSDRSATVAVALVGAAKPPAEVIVLASACVELAEKLLPIANQTVITDVAAAVEAARAAATTSRVNIEVNLNSIRDEQVRAELAAQTARVDDITTRADEVTKAVRAVVSG